MLYFDCPNFLSRIEVNFAPRANRANTKIRATKITIPSRALCRNTATRIQPHHNSLEQPESATMATKKGAYENAASDTDFRKKYDRAEYAAKAEEREAKEKEERKLRYEAKLAGKKYYAPLTGDEVLTQARASRLDVSANVGKVVLMPAGAATGKRGRGAGFYCPDCDLTFKDNLQWVEHENSMQHLRAIGQTGEVKRATREEVHDRIRLLWERMEEERKGDVKTLGERLEVRREEEEKEREARREKRRELVEKRKRVKEEEVKVKKEYGEDVRIEGEHDEDDMMASMGITGFGSSKK
jgi:U4/U6.U5 tri-snRNP component SNU23